MLADGLLGNPQGSLQLRGREPSVLLDQGKHEHPGPVGEGPSPLPELLYPMVTADLGTARPQLLHPRAPMPLREGVQSPLQSGGAFHGSTWAMDPVTE